MMLVRAASIAAEANLSFCRFQRSSGALSGGAVVIQLLRRAAPLVP